MMERSDRSPYAPSRLEMDAVKWALNKVPLKDARVIAGPVTVEDVRAFVKGAALLQRTAYGPFIFTTVDGSLWPGQDMDSIEQLPVVDRRCHRLEPARYIPAMAEFGGGFLWGYEPDDWRTWQLREAVEIYVRGKGLRVLHGACGVSDRAFYKAFDFPD